MRGRRYRWADNASCILAAKLLGRNLPGLFHAAMIVAGETVSVAKAYDEIMPPDSLDNSCRYF